MPTYDYECDGCGHRFELFQSMRDKPVRTCPKCKKRKVRRLVGAGSGLIFRGSGFYITDYKRSSGPAPASPKDSKPATGKTDSSGGGSKKDKGKNR